MAFNLRVDSLSGNANNRYWVPFNEPRPGEPSEAFLRRGHGSNWTYPRPRPRRARFPFASCDLRLDDSPRCRPTDNSTTVRTRAYVQEPSTAFRPTSSHGCATIVSAIRLPQRPDLVLLVSRPSVFARSSYYSRDSPRLVASRRREGKQAIESRESLVKNIEA